MRLTSPRRPLTCRGPEVHSGVGLPVQARDGAGMQHVRPRRHGGGVGGDGRPGGRPGHRVVGPGCPVRRHRNRSGHRPVWAAWSMTGMPELIALLHSFVSLAAVLVGWNSYLAVEADLEGPEARHLQAFETLGTTRKSGWPSRSATTGRWASRSVLASIPSPVASRGT